LALNNGVLQPHCLPKPGLIFGPLGLLAIMDP
jgi:hypothetical protein